MEQLSNVAEIMISYKSPNLNNPVITSSKTAFAEIRSHYDVDLIGLQEQFIVLYLNRSNRAIGVYRLSKGGLTGTVADTRLILGVALKIAACGIILSHNHPSGNLKASQADIEITNKIKNAAAFMEIQVIDHLIISPDFQYLSLAEDGQIS